MYSALPSSSTKPRRSTLNSLWHHVGNAVDTRKHRSRRRRGPCTPLDTVDEDWEELDEPDVLTTPTSSSDDTSSCDCSATSSSASSSSASPPISTIPLATPPSSPPTRSTRSSPLDADVDKPLPECPAPQPRPRRVNTYGASRRYGMYEPPFMEVLQGEQEVQPRRRHRRHASEGDAQDSATQVATLRAAHNLVVSTHRR